MSYQDPLEPSPESIPAKKGLSGVAIAGIGCGIAALMLVVVIGIAAYWLKDKARQFGADIAVSAMKDGLRELEVPEDQRDRIYARIDDVGQKFKDGQLDLQEVGAIFEKIGESPILSAGMALFFKRAYLKESGLSDQEQAAAEVSIQRFTRGVIDKKISDETSEELIDTISVTDRKGNRQLKKELTDDELRTFLKDITTAADEADVPAEVPEINFADEFDKAIDGALDEIQRVTPSE